MSHEEDSSLLFLIVQHLKMKGLLVAAQVLEEHVSQVEMPNASLNLQDIYKGWMKLCSHAEHLADGSDAPSKVEPEGGADESPPKDNSTDVEALLTSKEEVVERSNGRDHNGCHSPQPEEEEQTQQEQPEVIMDAPLESTVNQKETTPFPTEANNDCLDEGGDAEGQESMIGLNDHQDIFCTKDMPPPADANVMTERDEEDVSKMEVSDVTAQSEQEANQTGALESPYDDNMATEEQDHLDVAIALNIDIGETDVCLAEKVATPKKKKKKKASKTGSEEDQKTEQENPPENTKEGKKRKEEDEKEEVEDVTATVEKKKRKKRRNKEEDEKEEVEDVTATMEKKKRKKRRKEEEQEEGRGTKEVQWDEDATGADADPQKKLEAEGGAGPDRSSSQKRRRRRKRNRNIGARMRNQQQPDASEEDQTPPPKPSKRGVAHATLEDDAPKNKMMMKEEASSKENQSPTSITKRDKKKKTAASEAKVDNVGESLEVVSKKKKKKAANEEAGNGWNANDSLKGKRRKKEEQEKEAAQSHKTPVGSDSSANKKKQKKVKCKTMDDEDAELMCV